MIESWIAPVNTAVPTSPPDPSMSCTNGPPTRRKYVTPASATNLTSLCETFAFALLLRSTSRSELRSAPE
ncbi:MAG: hypothetical protein R3F11_19490 [Verrucomicrobiales bacterium]